MNCLNCNKEIPQTEGKRERRFCNSTCRSNYWQKEQRLKFAKSVPEKKGIKYPLEPKDMIKYQEAGKEAYDGSKIDLANKDEPPQYKAAEKPRMEQGESGVDFLIRLNEWKKQNKKNDIFNRRTA